MLERYQDRCTRVTDIGIGVSINNQFLLQNQIIRIVPSVGTAPVNLNLPINSVDSPFGSRVTVFNPDEIEVHINGSRDVVEQGFMQEDILDPYRYNFGTNDTFGTFQGLGAPVMTSQEAFEVTIDNYTLGLGQFILDNDVDLHSVRLSPNNQIVLYIANVRFDWSGAGLVDGAELTLDFGDPSLLDVGTIHSCFVYANLTNGGTIKFKIGAPYQWVNGGSEFIVDSSSTIDSRLFNNTETGGILQILPLDLTEYENVQADWNQTIVTEPDYIKNKPDVGGLGYVLQTWGANMQNTGHYPLINGAANGSQVSGLGIWTSAVVPANGTIDALTYYMDTGDNTAVFKIIKKRCSRTYIYLCRCLWSRNWHWCSCRCR